MVVSTAENKVAGSNGSALKASIEEITPQIAQRMLEVQARNRGISWRTVDRYAQDMKEGKWKVNGESVVLDEAGRLLDGQHRLQACLQAQIPFSTLIVRGADAAVFDTLDIGLRRSVIHVLSIRGELNAAVLGAALRVLVSMERGWQMAGNTNRTSEILDALERHPKIRQSCTFIESLKKDLCVVMVLSVPAGLHYLMWQKHNRDKADAFWTAVATGEELHQYDPRFALRRRMLGTFGASRRNDNLRMMTCAYAIKAWNSWIAGDEVAQIRWDAGKEPMPELT